MKIYLKKQLFEVIFYFHFFLIGHELLFQMFFILIFILCGSLILHLFFLLFKVRACLLKCVLFCFSLCRSTLMSIYSMLYLRVALFTLTCWVLLSTFKLLFCPSTSALTGRKRKWFKIDEAIEELQSHKPVHAEYLLRLADSCGPFRVYTPSTDSCPCTRVAENGASHCFVCSTQGSDLVNR